MSKLGVLILDGALLLAFLPLSSFSIYLSITFITFLLRVLWVVDITYLTMCITFRLLLSLLLVVRHYLIHLFLRFFLLLLLGISCFSSSSVFSAFSLLIHLFLPIVILLLLSVSPTFPLPFTSVFSFFYSFYSCMCLGKAICVREAENPRNKLYFFIFTSKKILKKNHVRSCLSHQAERSHPKSPAPA